MKKAIAILCTLMLISLSPVSLANTARPLLPSLPAAAFAGREMHAVPAFYDTENGTLLLDVYEPAVFAGEDLQMLSVGDTILVNDEEIPVTSIRTESPQGSDMDYYTVNAEDDELALFFSPIPEFGNYTCLFGADQTLWTAVAETEASLSSDFAFINRSDPEKEEQTLSLADLEKTIQSGSLDVDNCIIRFDEEGKMAALIWDFVP